MILTRETQLPTKIKRNNPLTNQERAPGVQQAVPEGHPGGARGGILLRLAHKIKIKSWYCKNAHNLDFKSRSCDCDTKVD